MADRKPIAVACGPSGWIGAEAFDRPPEGWMWVSDDEFWQSDKIFYLPHDVIRRMDRYTPAAGSKAASAVYPTEAAAMAALAKAGAGTPTLVEVAK